MRTSRIAAIAGAVIRSLLLLALVTGIAVVLSLLGQQKVAVLALTLGACAMMMWSSSKPFPLTLWTILLPAFSGVCVLVAQLALLESLPLQPLLLSWAGVAGLVVGIALGVLHRVQMRDGAPWARRTVAYVAVWSLTYVALQGSALLGLRDAAGLAAAANVFAVALMVGVAVALLWRSRRARHHRPGSRPAFAAPVVLVVALAAAVSVWADTALEAAPKVLKESDLPAGYARSPHGRDYEAKCRRLGSEYGERLGSSRPVDCAEEWFNYKDRNGTGWVHLQVHYMPTPAGAQRYLDSLIGVDRERYQDRYNHSERLGIGDSAFYRHHMHLGRAWIRVGNWAIILRACLPHSGLVRVTSDRDWLAAFVPKNIAFGKRLAALVAKRVAGIRHTWPGQVSTPPPTPVLEPEPSPPPREERPTPSAPFNPFEDIRTEPAAAQPTTPFNPFDDVATDPAAVIPAPHDASFDPVASRLGRSAVPAGVVGAGLGLLSGVLAAAGAAAAAGVSAATGSTATRILSGQAARDWLQKNGYLDADGNFQSGYRDWADRLPSEGNPTDLRHIQYASNDPDRIAPDVDLDILVREGDAAPSPPTPAAPPPPLAVVPPPPPPPPPPQASPPVPKRADPEPEDPLEVWREEQRGLMRCLLEERRGLQQRIHTLTQEVVHCRLAHRNACTNGWRRGAWNTLWFALTNRFLFGAKVAVHPAGRTFLTYLASNLASGGAKAVLEVEEGWGTNLPDEYESASDQAFKKAGAVDVPKAVGRRLADATRSGPILRGRAKAASRALGPLFDALELVSGTREDMVDAEAYRNRGSAAYRERAKLKLRLMDVQQDLDVTMGAFK